MHQVPQKGKELTLKEMIASSNKRPVLSRKEAVERARRKRLGENLQRSGYQTTSEGRQSSGEQAKRRRKQASGQAPSGMSKPSGRSASERRVIERKVTERRVTEKRTSGKKAFEKSVPENSIIESGFSGNRLPGRRLPKKKRRRLLPAAFALVLILLALFVVVRILPGYIRKIGNTVIRDAVPPVIELKSDPDYIVYPGQEYEEEGYTATDDRDGDLTDQVSRTVEDGQICYRVTDKAGNTAVLYREIPYAEVSSNKLEGNISAKELAKMRKSFPKAGGGSSGSGKIVYLTFDDGPGQYTERLLQTLERNKVHVTFFVTGAFPVYEDMIKKEYEAGHSIGIHTFSHDFNSIYADTDAFWKDIGKMQEIVVRQTGHPTNLMRFAGGSSNTVGVWQTPGIMELLAKQAPEKGFQYFDWNVSSGDGAAEGDSAMVISRITSQIQNYDQSVVLCHDTKEYTVNAMEYLIPWLLDNGYTIRPLSFDSEPAHHVEADE